MKKTDTEKKESDFQNYLKIVEEENAQMRAGTWPKPSPATAWAATSPGKKQNVAPVGNPLTGDGSLIVLAEVIGFKVPAEIVAAIADKQKERDILFEHRENLAKLRTVGHFSKALEADASALRQAAQNGTELDNAPIPRHEHEEQFAAKKNVVNTAMAQVIREAATLARPLLEQFKTDALAYVAAREKLEADFARQFHLDYTASVTIQSLRAIIGTLGKRIPAPGTEMFQNPSSFLPPFTPFKK